MVQHDVAGKVFVKKSQSLNLSPKVSERILLLPIYAYFANQVHKRGPYVSGFDSIVSL